MLRFFFFHTASNVLVSFQKQKTYNKNEINHKIKEYLSFILDLK